MKQNKVVPPPKHHTLRGGGKALVSFTLHIILFSKPSFHSVSTVSLVLSLWCPSCYISTKDRWSNYPGGQKQWRGKSGKMDARTGQWLLWTGDRNIQLMATTQKNNLWVVQWHYYPYQRFNESLQCMCLLNLLTPPCSTDYARMVRILHKYVTAHIIRETSLSTIRRNSRKMLAMLCHLIT
jgi:hypothetical protein